MSSTARADRRSLLRLSGTLIALPFLAIATFFPRFGNPGPRPDAGHYTNTVHKGGILR